MNMKNFITIPLIITTLQASNTLEKSGDILRILIPAITHGYTYYIDDKDGQNEFHKSFATNIVATYALKYAINKKRPNGKDNHSFPSGHTSVTFQSATFLHKRYGFKYALPAYIGATLTGYSRVESDNHYTIDVVSGAVLGAISSYYFTTKYKGVIIEPKVNGHVFGFTFTKKLGI
jgi:membrane-associated phospholipid phosphatase